MTDGENHKGQRCPTDGRLCQEGWCSECVVSETSHDTPAEKPTPEDRAFVRRCLEADNDRRRNEAA